MFLLDFNKIDTDQNCSNGCGEEVKTVRCRVTEFQEGNHYWAFWEEPQRVMCDCFEGMDMMSNEWVWFGSTPSIYKVK
jgi:hypothetical protein